jgi:integrase
MVDLSRKRTRMALPQRREPHWQQLARGAFLGFRRGADTWIARYRGRDGKQQYHALPGVRADDFDEAKQRAEAWLEQMGAAGVRSARRGTVRAALEAYLTDLTRHGRAQSAETYQRRFELVIYGDPLAGFPLDSVTRNDVLEWRERLASDEREPGTINRYVSSVVAGINRAIDLGSVGNPRAWKLERLVNDREDEGTAVFLTVPQRKALLAAATLHAGDFFRALELTGARPHELAKAVVSDFDGESIRLSHRKGSPPKLRVRHTVLSPEGVAHMRRAAKDKAPQSLLFPDANGNSWRQEYWAREVRAAVARHNETSPPGAQLPVGLITAYGFRHARISELLQVYGIDPLTVAKQTGTSLQQIEATYHKFIGSAMKEKLAAVRES